MTAPRRSRILPLIICPEIRAFKEDVQAQVRRRHSWFNLTRESGRLSNEFAEHFFVLTRQRQSLLKTNPTLFVSLLLALSGAAGPALAAPAFPVVPLSAGTHLIKAEVASTPSERAQGLMHREALGANEGMIFVFGAPAKVCMWMKNTPLPLSVAFLDQQGRIINIEDMEPNTLTSHCGDGPTNYALEMRQGWFAQKRILPGTVIRGLPQ